MIKTTNIIIHMASIVGYSYKSAKTLTQSGGPQIRLKPTVAGLKCILGPPLVNMDISICNTVFFSYNVTTLFKLNILVSLVLS